MPELPEVETIVRGLQAALPGRSVISIQLGKTDFIDDPGALERELPRSHITSVSRHGKFIVLKMQRRGEVATDAVKFSQDLLLLVHLGMTGQLTVNSATAPIPPHTHARLLLDNGRELRYTDIRRFGSIRVIPESESEKFLGPLGADPLEISENGFCDLISGRHARIKGLLLDQRVLRGMGNIYTDESLWRARIHPARVGCSLKSQECARLFRAVQKILREAIRLGGSSISDYVDASGERGGFQIRHRVYQREGKKCSRCGSLIRRIIVAGRSSYFCPQCQRAPRQKSVRRSRTRVRSHPFRHQEHATAALDALYQRK
ncbi:MAG TPA: bifunctional DNA-formamidopyrimidine glycosylase/DNA-(apurinic or apyrimidinic site) lyase [Candidatus Acidoferrales bacterium]|nr:bifunctional DNA-formamidopyrimidine glycosylase/DNA-(apurinic or apyrimidinic site) lyase [Candidatus Acidoferrales bacterium]